MHPNSTHSAARPARAKPRLIRGSITLAGLLAPELSPEPIPWAQVAFRQPGRSGNPTTRLWPMNEAGESLTINDAPVAINIGGSSVLRTLVRRLKIRSLRSAIRNGSLNFETTLPDIKATNRTQTIILTVVALIVVAILLTTPLPPRARIVAPTMIFVAVGYWLWDQAERLYSRRDRPVYPRWIHVSPGTLRWRESTGPIQQIALNTNARKTLDRFRYGSDGQAEYILAALAQAITPPAPSITRSREFLLLTRLALRMAWPFVLVVFLPFAAAAMLIPGPRGPLPLTSAFLLALMPVYVIAPLFVAFVGISLCFARVARRRARRARAALRHPTT